MNSLLTNFLLTITKDDYGSSIIETKGPLETLGFGAMILVLGMLAVFAVLTLIWIALIVFKICFHDLPNKKNNSKNIEKIIPDVKESEFSDIPDDNSNEIVAVIAAAIAMAESENIGTKFKVVSFRKK